MISHSSFTGDQFAEQFIQGRSAKIPKTVCQKRHSEGLTVLNILPVSLFHLPSIRACLTGSIRETISARSVKEAFGQVTI